jgi:hypothetical protein
MQSPVEKRRRAKWRIGGVAARRSIRNIQIGRPRPAMPAEVRGGPWRGVHHRLRTIERTQLIEMVPVVFFGGARITRVNRLTAPLLEVKFCSFCRAGAAGLDISQMRKLNFSDTDTKFWTCAS